MSKVLKACNNAHLSEKKMVFLKKTNNEKECEKIVETENVKNNIKQEIRVESRIEQKEKEVLTLTFEDDEEEDEKNPRCSTFVYYHKVVEAIIPFIPQVTEKLPSSTGPYVVCDYGANDGSFTFPIMTTVADILKGKHGDDTYINIFYEDIAQNDFSHLFGFINKRIDAYLMKNVYTFASGTNFYRQCFPPSSVHLGLCTSAIHWLSTSPCPLKNSIFVSRLDGEESEEYRLYSKQAAHDMEQFLEHRATEMVSGGYLIVTSPYEHEESNFLKHMDKEWQNCLQDGLITKEEYVATNLAKYFRSEAELVAPAKDPSSAAHRLGLRVVDTGCFSCKMTEGTTTAEQLVMGIRSFTARTLYNGLSETRPADEKHAILDTLYDRLVQDLKSGPEQNWADVFRTQLVIFRKD